MKNFNINDLIKRYYAGEPIYKLSKEIGVCRATLTNRFKKMGVTFRTRIEAVSLSHRNRTPEQYILNTMAAHNSVRGKKHSLEELEYRAKCLQNKPCNVSPAERIICNELIKAAIPIIPQFAIGKYNVDILAFGLIAIEIYGGGWHATKNHTIRDNYILDQGFDRFTIWVDRPLHHPFDAIRCINEIITFIEFRRLNPTSARCHKMIWSDGNTRTR